ncbi:hypothetical protein VAS14_05833 [Photobacterium angustum S14]|uniref:Uncharacterized protein n=1 Tax=Photobacterium angustum (strain S14 / CCUG 15956) TaxID=314292 RepID=Q1ZRW1_PHOAS|nr:hypothetical protein VAS14_05833 [Photobacterium angustum S14]
MRKVWVERNKEKAMKNLAAYTARLLIC